jgi:hypothetical protein
MKPLLAALSLTMASLGLGTYLAALDIAWNSAANEAAAPGDWRLQYFVQRDELGRPVCRRSNFTNPERPLVRMGPNCP